MTLPEALELARKYRLAGRLDEAASVYVQVLRVVPEQQPARAGVEMGLAGVWLLQRKHAEAEALLRRLLARVPELPAGAHNNLGAALLAQGKNGDAEVVLRHAAQLDRQDAGIWRNLAFALLLQDKYADAEPVLRSLLALQPDDGVATVNLMIALLNQGHLVESAALRERLLQTPPTDPGALSSLLYALGFDAACTPERYLQEARRLGALLAAGARPYTHWNTALPGTALPCLRVGLVSGDLRNHPVGMFLENFLPYLDRTKVQLIAYTTRAVADARTARLKSRFAEWRAIDALDDARAARQIRDDGVHVLIDLAGHTAFNRLSLFAWRPAPIQVSWLGYALSTGVPAIDWLLVDAACVPASSRVLYSERCCFLPDVRACFAPPCAADVLLPSPPPLLASGRVTFGSFQALSKLGDPVLALWARVLAACPGARLRVQNRDMALASARAVLLQRLGELGVPAERVTLVAGMPYTDYLAAHAEVDILLDTFPYPGHTTTCEALWMGVPTMTLGGRTMLSRNGVSVLMACGLGDWVAENENDYVDRVVRHAADGEKLALLRVGLRARVQASPLCDGARFAAAFTNTLHALWRVGGPTGRRGQRAVIADQ